MALINHAKREINAKIVYYGSEGAGKRSSLQYIYDRIRPSLRGELKAPVSCGDALFFFDFSPFENPVFGDYHIRFHVYTLPGKVSNPAAWKMTLKGADGLVVVADATPERAIAARASISELRGFLAAYGVGLHDIPCVLQLDKNGRSHYSSVAEMASALDLPHTQVCLSDAVSGEGVLETLSLLSREIMIRIGQDAALQVVAGDVTPAGGDDAEVNAALISLETKPDGLMNESVPAIEERLASPLVTNEGARGQLQVVLSAGGAICNDGIVKVPLEFSIAGSTHRMVVSIAIDRV